MTSLSSFSNPATYHILTYGTLLGSNVFQSFIGGIVAYQCLPRPQFATLQQKTFPIYFGLQTACPLIMALTYPAMNMGLRTGPSGLGGVFAADNRSDVLFPLASIFLLNLLNLVALGPWTTKVMRLRKHQETRDGKKAYDPPPHTPEMQKMNKQFSLLHGASSLANMAAFLMTCWYGAILAERLS